MTQAFDQAKYETACNTAWEAQSYPQATAILNEMLGERTELLQTGGFTMVGVWTLPNGKVVTVNGECACIFDNLDEFWEAPSEVESHSWLDFTEIDDEPSDEAWAQFRTWLTTQVETA